MLDRDIPCLLDPKKICHITHFQLKPTESTKEQIELAMEKYGLTRPQAEFCAGCSNATETNIEG